MFDKLNFQEIIGKIPPEYIRYMDLNEKAPKIKKKVGAEYKVKLRKKDTPSGVSFFLASFFLIFISSYCWQLAFTTNFYTFSAFIRIGIFPWSQRLLLE